MNRIKDLRISRGMKQEELADLLHCSRPSLSKYEQEQIDLNTKMVFQLCDIFGCTSDYLLGRSAMPNTKLTEEEYALIRQYRAADERSRKMVQLTLEPFSRGCLHETKL